MVCSAHIKSRIGGVFSSSHDDTSLDLARNRVAPVHMGRRRTGRPGAGLPPGAGPAAGDAQAEDALDTLLSNLVNALAIEGKRLDVSSVRSSLARRLGLSDETPRRPTAQAEGLAELMLDATRHADAALDLPRLLQWHRWLFSAGDDLLALRIRVGALRGGEPMQVVSGHYTLG